MNNPYFLEIKSELKLALSEKNHSLKYCVLGSIGLDNTPQNRIIGLQQFSEDFNFTFFTDERSKKVSQIRANHNVSLIFYCPEKKIQIKIEGIASMVKDTKAIREKWLQVYPKGETDYTTTEVPGTKINHPEELTFLKKKNFFAVIEIETESIEYLKLRDQHHFKVQFHKDSLGWTSEFLVP